MDRIYPLEYGNSFCPKRGEQVKQPSDEKNLLKYKKRKYKISLHNCKEEDPLKFYIKFPFSLKTFNRLMGYSKEENIQPNEELYLPPDKVVPFIKEEYLNAAKIQVKSNKKLTLYFEKEGHAKGFVDFFSSI